ncbi:hypothetical protein D9M69_551880 [compost metagenome]
MVGADSRAQLFALPTIFSLPCMCASQRSMSSAVDTSEPPPSSSHGYRPRRQPPPGAGMYRPAMPGTTSRSVTTDEVSAMPSGSNRRAFRKSLKLRPLTRSTILASRK